MRQQAETITEYREELARLESHILVDVDCEHVGDGPNVQVGGRCVGRRSRLPHP